MKIKNMLFCLPFLYTTNYSTAISDPTEAIFTYIYKKNLWLSNESISGPGSELRVTQRMQKELGALIKRFNISSIADAPCGDCNWIRHVDIGACRYIGFDIVQELIEQNKKLFGDTKEFRHCNLIDNIIDKVDLIICRDMLAHLNYEQVVTVLRNFKKSGSKYIAVTTGINIRENHDISRTGDWRGINFELAPFNFPKPLAVIIEDVPFEWERGKCLALWFLDDINV